MVKLGASPCKPSKHQLNTPPLVLYHRVYPLPSVQSEPQTNRYCLNRPNPNAQAALIRETYRKAGLDLANPHDRPQYFEAHGTGTPAGDPVEAEAIHSGFFKSPSQNGDSDHDHKPLLVGSIKTVLGHSEGTAGIAAILKASLALQQSAVPPNLLLENLNPRIERFSAHLRVPKSLAPWPATSTGQPRRASVNR